MKQVYTNRPQMISRVVKAPVEYCVWGRGTGKSSGVLAPRIVENVFSMPRSLGVLVSDTYQSTLTKTLPGILEGLSRLGYTQGVDYFFGQFAPKSWKWEKPYNAPLKPQYFMHWRNGAGMLLISQDRPNSANGTNIDWIVGDEAKFLNQKRFEEELLPANRGHRQKFGHLSNHHSIVLTTDQPTTEKGKWILKKKEQFNRPDNFKRYKAILLIEIEIQKLESQMSGYSKSTQARYMRRISRLKREQELFRMGSPSNGVPQLIHYSEADSFSNIHILGAEYMLQMAETLSPAVFRTSILNEPLGEVPMGFYPSLSEKRHGYTMYDNNYLDQLSLDFSKPIIEDSRMDKDVLKDRPLDMAMDYGGSINGLVVGQHYGEEYRFLKSMYVLHPKKLRHLIADFKRYYKYHDNKLIRYYYDHTAKGTNAMIDRKYFQEVEDLLREDDEHGSWTVEMIDVGSTPTHQFRYNMWDQVLKLSDPSIPLFRYNEKNCSSWALSCKLTALKTTRKGFEKDKSKEKKQDFPQEQAPHLSDAGDTLLFGVMKPYLTGGVDAPFISARL